jgi:guanylate kinase
LSDGAPGDVGRRGLCLVLAAPSGAGKGAIGRALLAAEPALSFSVSATTRAPRPGEQDGVHYHFMDDARFTALAQSGGLLEWARVFGRGYGTPRAPVEASLAAGRDVLFDIDWQGHRLLRAALPEDVVSIFLLPPSLAELEARLRHRGTDDAAEIARRMNAARDEIAHWPEFDHAVVNRELDTAIADVRSILRAARLRTARQTGLERFVAAL